jgi:asparagine synthase (glutamine-hydrolysing)
VSRLARRHVTVSLSGDGGDELFGGYNRYLLGEALWRRAGRVPQSVRRIGAPALGRVPLSAWDRMAAAAQRVARHRNLPRTPGDKIQKALDVLDSPDPDELYLRLASAWSDPLAVVRTDREATSPATEAGGWPALDDLVERMMYRDLVSYIPGDSLVKLDRAAMAVGLETRVPLLDHRVVELAWRFPRHLKIADGTGKWALRQVLGRYVPAELVDRPKMGFDLPIGDWLRGPLRPWAEELLDPRRLAQEGYLHAAPITQAWDQHQRGHRNHAYRLWAVLMFQAWLAEERPGG